MGRRPRKEMRLLIGIWLSLWKILDNVSKKGYFGRWIEVRMLKQIGWRIWWFSENVLSNRSFDQSLRKFGLQSLQMSS